MAEILIIEDNTALRTEIQKHLEGKGHSVTCAVDGAEGYETLKSIPFDVIILDIRMPGMQGTDVLKKVAETLPCHPPIIVVTGHGDKDTAIAALHFGAFDFIEKPFKPSTLDGAVDKALTERKQDALSFRSFLDTNQKEELTPREREVAFLAAEGLSNEEIAERLALGNETVKSHLKKIFRKLGVTNRTTLAARIRK